MRYHPAPSGDSAHCNVMATGRRREHGNGVYIAPWVGPGHRKDEVVVAVPVQLIDGFLGVLLVEEVDKGEAARRVRLTILSEVYALDWTEAAEELSQVRVLHVLGQIRDTHRATVVTLGREFGVP